MLWQQGSPWQPTQSNASILSNPQMCWCLVSACLVSWMAAYGTLMEAYCLLIDANDPESHLYRVQWLHYPFCENSKCPVGCTTSKYIAPLHLAAMILHLCISKWLMSSCTGSKTSHSKWGCHGNGYKGLIEHVVMWSVVHELKAHCEAESSERVCTHFFLTIWDPLRNIYCKLYTLETYAHMRST